MGEHGSSVAEYLRPLKSENILHEGFLRVRADHGFVGLRPWLLRYFVICKHDHTLRRFHTADEVDAPKEKNLKVRRAATAAAAAAEGAPAARLRPRYHASLLLLAAHGSACSARARALAPRRRNSPDRPSLARASLPRAGVPVEGH